MSRVKSVIGDVFPDMATLVPHDGAMLLLDRVISAGAEDICVEVTIRDDSMFCADLNADGQRGVGSWVGIEYMAQAIAAFAGYQVHLSGDDVKIGFLLGSRRYEVKQSAFKVGTVLHVHALRTLQAENGLGAFECRIEDGETAAVWATASVTVFQPDNVNEFLQRSEV